VLRTACRRGTLPVATAREIVVQVGLLPIRIDASPPQPAALVAFAAGALGDLPTKGPVTPG